LLFRFAGASFFRIFCSVSAVGGALLSEPKMTDSQKLLAEYARNGSESAFRELVSRYLNLVYSTALRLVGGDTHLAEDVAQTVFIGLARRGRTLSTGVMLGGWLHQHTYHVATRAVRAERRRQSREREAVEMNTLQDDSGANLRQVAPILDEAITQLGSEDRCAILLRFFEQRDFRSVGEALGSNEDAARMRVNRAMEKLHSLLKHRGVTLSAAALGTVLTAEAVIAAPAGLAVTVSGVALAGAAAGTGTLTLLKIMTATQLKLGLGTLVIAGVTTVLVVQHQAQIKLREENQSLRQQINQLTTKSERPAERLLTPHLPAPPIQVATQTNASLADDLQPTNINLYSRFKDEAPKLTARQVEAYLQANRTNAASLLAAYRTSSDPALLKEAMEKYPNDPRVAFEAVLDKDLSPEQQRQWLDTFEKSAPDNALANYLSAFNYFNSGQIDQGIQELTAASGKQPDDYTLARAQDDEEAYLSAGYSAAEAERISDGWLMIPQLSQVKKLGVDLVDLAKAYNQSGDPASAQAAFQMAINLGQGYADPSNDPMLIHQLVGMAIQKIAFSAMDPNASYGNNSQTVQDQINQITQNRAAITELVQQATPWLPTMSDQDILNYENRRRAFGEVAALQWVTDKYGQK
jgi:RNA polymerase sigma factor (sigma-70 family)